MPFHQKVVNHPVFISGHYDTGFIEQHMAGGKGAKPSDSSAAAEDAAEARRVAFMMAAIVAFRRDKKRASEVSTATATGGGDPWKNFGRRAQMRGGWR
jgi:acetyl/propionyl-CoA carboxylase alpha subunit